MRARHEQASRANFQVNVLQASCPHYKLIRAFTTYLEIADNRGPYANTDGSYSQNQPEQVKSVRSGRKEGLR